MLLDVHVRNAKIVTKQIFLNYIESCCCIAGVIMCDNASWDRNGFSHSDIRGRDVTVMWKQSKLQIPQT